MFLSHVCFILMVIIICRIYSDVPPFFLKLVIYISSLFYCGQYSESVNNFFQRTNSLVLPLSFKIFPFLVFCYFDYFLDCFAGINTLGHCVLNFKKLWIAINIHCITAPYGQQRALMHIIKTIFLVLPVINVTFPPIPFHFVPAWLYSLLLRKSCSQPANYIHCLLIVSDMQFEKMLKMILIKGHIYTTLWSPIPCLIHVIDDNVPYLVFIF